MKGGALGVGGLALVGFASQKIKFVGWVEERDPTFRNIDSYAATNAFPATEVFKDAIKEGMDLDNIEVERSPICRPDSDCWKVFEQARKVYRFTIDVGDVVAVMVWPVRSLVRALRNPCNTWPSYDDHTSITLNF